MDWKKIFRPSFSYGISLVPPPGSRPMQWALDGQGCGVGRPGPQIGEGLENVIWELGLGCRWAGVRVNI